MDLVDLADLGVDLMDWGADLVDLEADFVREGIVRKGGSAYGVFWLGIEGACA